MQINLYFVIIPLIGNIFRITYSIIGATTMVAPPLGQEGPVPPTFEALGPAMYWSPNLFSLEMN